MGYLLSLQPTFTQGLVLGQLSIFLLLALVLKYLFLVSDPSTSHHLPTTAAIPRSPVKQELPLREPRKESTEWLNTVLAEIIETYRSELRGNQSGPEGDESIRSKVERKLNDMRPAGFMDPILVHSVNLGSSAPHLTSARINPALSADTQVEFDMTYTDTASISLSTSVLFNYPLPYFARLPVSLTLSLRVFSSKIIITLPRPISHAPTLTLALAPSFTLDLNISSLLGSRAKLADVPKLHDMIESQIRKALTTRGSWTVVLPGISRPQGDADVRHASEEIDVKLVNESFRPPNVTRISYTTGHSKFVRDDFVKGIPFPTMYRPSIKVDSEIQSRLGVISVPRVYDGKSKDAGT